MMKLSRLINTVPALQQAVRHYDGLPSRDKKYLKAMVAALALAILYFLIWLPSQNYMLASRSQMGTAMETLEYVKQSIPQARLVAKLQNKTAGSLDPQRIVSTISGAGKKYNIELKRFEPSGDSSLRVWLEDVPFNGLVQWLQELNKSHGLKVSEIAIDRDDKPGLVNARLLIGS
jgi:general secretion pathway protein M